MGKESIIYGIHPLTEAIRAGKEVEKVLIQTGLRGEHFRELFQLLEAKAIPWQHVPVQKLNKIVSRNHQGVVGFISPVDFQKIEDLLPTIFEDGKLPLLLVLDRVTDVRNFGALARTAECAGVHAILLPSRGSALITEDAVKTSSGALLRIPVCRPANLKKDLQYLRDSGIRVVGITEKCKNAYYTEDYRLPTALVLGSEEDGISDAYLKLCDARVNIPMFGEIASLNVSVAGGIVMFEVVKQRISEI